MNIYTEILNYPMEDLFEGDYYSIPLNYKELKTILSILQTHGEYEINESISNFLYEEYDLDIDYLLSTDKHFQKNETSN